MRQLSFTPRFSEVSDRQGDDRTVSTVFRKPLKRLIKHSLLIVTSLKRGVNERTPNEATFCFARDVLGRRHFSYGADICPMEAHDFRRRSDERQLPLRS